MTNSIKQRVRLPGFRPGKAPVSMIQSRFESEIRNEVLEVILPQAFRERVEKEELKVVGTPDISELQFEPGKPIRFKADFEVAPEFEIAEYRGLPVQYEEPTVSEEEVDKRLDSMRESKAEYVNLDPRPMENRDFVLVHLKSLSGLAEPIEQDVQIEVGAEDTLAPFNEACWRDIARRKSKEVDVTYPDDYGQERLAGQRRAFSPDAESD